MKKTMNRIATLVVAMSLAFAAFSNVRALPQQVATTSVDIRVNLGKNDAEESSDGSMHMGSSDLELVTDATVQTVGIRFTGVNIPSGATILNAYIQFKVDEISDVATNLTIKGEASANALAFTTTALNVSSRAKTASAVTWSPVPWTTVGATGTDQRTPNLAPVIQEIVSQSGWASGNSLAIIITGSGKRVAKSYNGDAAGAPLLHIEYSADTVVSTTPTATTNLPTATPQSTQTVLPTATTATSAPTQITSPTQTLVPTATSAPTQIISPTATLAPTSSSSGPVGGSVVAFPGAEGFGAQSAGGRGGKVIEVTNLNDSGTGSLRACVAATGPRICVFRIGGTITTLSEIDVKNPYLTVAGQTAPGGGITLRASQDYTGEPFVISTHDVVVRYVRFRAGASATPNSSRRSLTVNTGAYNVILDHCSFSWATDQPLLLIDGAHNVTVQWSIVSEALANSTHYEAGYIEHSTGLSVSGKQYHSTEKTGNISLHHNLIANNGGRNPQNAGFGLEDVVNNVIYDWRKMAFTTHDLQANVPSNVVNNYFKRGVDTTGYEVRGSHVNDAMTGPQIYVSGNLGPHITDPSQPAINIVAPSDRIYVVPNRFPAASVTTTSAQQAYSDVLAKAGVRIPTMDAVDKRIIEQVKRGEGRIIDCVSATELTSPINCSTRVFLSAADYTKYGINDPLDSKGWPILAAGTAPQDSDHDGMPDSWETAHGLNPNLDDSAQDRNGDGYTNIEEYINGLVLP
ncbi:MAG TPA: hypothetical protein VK206_28555 [Anaerolineales bacterium]|nr:hypothetical protein [Anaerolineales bacterium]